MYLFVDKIAMMDILFRILSGNNSVVEYDLAKVGVAGSNPVSRSIFFWRRSQVVRQRSAKPPFTGSNPVAASICLNEFAGFWNQQTLFIFRVVSCKIFDFFVIFGGFDFGCALPVVFGSSE